MSRKSKGGSICLRCKTVTVGLLPIGLRPDHTDYVGDTCYLQLTGHFFAEGPAVTRCLVGHDLPEPTERVGWVACPTCAETAQPVITLEREPQAEFVEPVARVRQLSLFEGV